MAAMKVVVTSTDVIIPAVPTPTHLRRLNRSFLDQLTPQFYMPFIYFYRPPPTANTTATAASVRQNIDSLKKSLSDILPIYYPLAGRATDPLFIDCNDAGVHFSESTVDIRLSDFIDNKIADQLNLLLPFPDMGIVDDDRILAIQANVFQCGGLALGICCSHKIADALSIITFVNSWANSSRGGGVTPAPPNFDAASIFPPQDMSKLLAISKGDCDDPNQPGIEAPAERTALKIVTKVVTFTGSALSHLRDKYTKPELRPSLIESISAFMWILFLKFQENPPTREGTKYVVTQGVNLRVRADPPMPDNLFGNISRFSLAFPEIDVEPEEIVYRLVSSMRNGIKKIDGDYVKRLQRGDMDLVVKEIGELIGGEVVPFGFSSLNRFPIYDADFGWGRPVWASSVHVPFKNVVGYFPTESGDGVEAWINLEEEDMHKLEADQDFVYVCRFVLLSNIMSSHVSLFSSSSLSSFLAKYGRLAIFMLLANFFHSSDVKGQQPNK
ncbi:stemmadenine O-acetyltransferase-like [Impatiens glandulifera]|uniref:stemmadenine O-acetyltransferase-like n=1 Tax=Impatiens glandulifera TaxID=253017 RepID=UPI001FB08FD6|nr:stemmadenine O-acetyltransferase-like [Impatiens glandulifera]